MEKTCNNCKANMQLKLRKLVFHTHEIDNVPIFTCSQCKRSEVVEWVKPELKKVIDSLHFSMKSRRIPFEEYSEYSNLLLMVANETEEEVIEEIVEERINQLLDLLLLAEALNDQIWVNELSTRLKQVITPI